MPETKKNARPDYGLDAPPVILTFAGIALAGIVLLVLSFFLFAGLLDNVIATIGLIGAVTGLFTVAAMTFSSRVGKIRLRDRLLAAAGLRGDEDVLDLGCGRGLMLLGAAARVPAGSATGIDLWRAQDQRGSNRENCLANARRLGVQDRVTLVDGDMTRLPFPDDSFDLITASLAIHNIPDRTARAEVIRSAARVLRPGGRLLLIDFTRTDEYAADARECGLTDVTRSGARLVMYPPVRVVQARKPPAPNG